MNRHLVFRCATCRATTSLQAEWSDQCAAEVTCASCHALYRLEAGRDRGDSDQAYFEQVRRYAEKHRIDLASAYSVAEGIIPREKIRTLPAGSPEIPRAGTSAARSLALLALLILSLGVLARQLRPTPAFVAAPGGAASEASVATTNLVKIVPVTYRVNAEGRLTQVTAPDPRGALLAFCEHESNRASLRAISIAPATPPGPQRRTGVAQERDRPGSFAWIEIQLDADTARWTIGDGLGPVRVERDREQPSDAQLLTD